MRIPTMPGGYYLMQESGFWYVLKDEGLGLKRLLDKDGNEKRFDGNTASLAQAAVYAQKHKDAGLSYKQEVPSSDIRISEVKDE
jgi:hypothetical protein